MQIRSAKLSDSDDILNWRNDASSRIMFIESKLVSKCSHLKWFIKALNEKSCYLYIGEKNKIKANGLFVFMNEKRKCKGEQFFLKNTHPERMSLVGKSKTRTSNVHRN